MPLVSCRPLFMLTQRDRWLEVQPRTLGMSRDADVPGSSKQDRCWSPMGMGPGMSAPGRRAAACTAVNTGMLHVPCSGVRRR